MAKKFTRVDERLHGYLLAHQPPEHDEVGRLRRLTQKMSYGRMQIAPEQGHLLALLVGVMAARHILEVGTFTGASTLAMALALQPEGRIVTLDINEEWTGIAREHWRRAGVADRIDLRIGPAADTLARLERDRGADKFDFAFVDADKTEYDIYYESALRLVRPGGLIVLDNMLRRGRVADPEENDVDTVAIRSLNSKIAADRRVNPVLLPIASGMTLARRL